MPVTALIRVNRKIYKMTVKSILIRATVYSQLGTISQDRLIGECACALWFVRQQSGEYNNNNRIRVSPKLKTMAEAVHKFNLAFKVSFQ